MTEEAAILQPEIEAKIELTTTSHGRLSEFEKLVYPVVSRRSKGLSLGINANPDQACNFDCVYCQVDRVSEDFSYRKFNLPQLEMELRGWLQQMREEGGTYRGHPLKDFGVAGDGEPTMLKELPQVLELMIQLKEEYQLPEEVQLILFSNGTGIDRRDLQEIFPRFHKHGGEIWFKLDAWSQETSHRVNRPKATFESLRQKLSRTAQRYPLVLQSCIFQWENIPFAPENYQPYVKLIQELLSEGAQLKKIQAYTLARKPSESAAKPWSDEEMDQLGSFFQSELPVPIEIYYEK